MTPIITERLKLVSMSRACLQALYEGDYKKAQLIGGFVISPDCSLVKSVWLGHRLKMIAEDPDQLPWLYRAEVGIADNSAATYAAVSGSGANTGSPDFNGK